MRTYFFVLFFVLFAVSSQPVSAQAGNPATADSVSLSQQFDEMLRVSNRYQGFKVIRQNYLAAFIANVTDSIGGYTKEISTLNGTISTQAERLDKQETTIQEKDLEISQLNEEKDGVSLLGFQLSKATYSLIMWSAIIGLLALLLLALARMRLAVSSANEASTHNAKLTEELEKARKRRLEVEQNLRRQLQDEINKRGK
ncbi:hypothetical protein [Neolewinella agarilytica]|uniref:tRNA (Guanine-N1)-methyltransferase n=1 Tax=Neolewinella agarilytica TaxID=478744 RepID=A0A1H9P3F6_9BACT|nr:hypothetical protein [Neolewinella agarilytica]SER42661.1 hypothetical protein SAMN05444359_14212 [Neolewinella agarilytica]